MKNQISIVAVIAVAAVAAIGANAFANNGSSSNSLAETGMFMGHVELILRDSDGMIKEYKQFDNVVTNVGDSCASELLFGDTGVTTCAGAAFNKIGILNGTSYTLGETSTMANANAASTTGTDNIMAIVNAVATVPGTAGTQGTDTTIVNSGHLFNFVDNQNDTTIRGVFLTDALCTESTVAGQEGGCTTKPAEGEIFATQSTTLTVSGGDTLEVTWTITVGSSA